MRKKEHKHPSIKVMEMMIGRKLNPEEVVHHKNSDPNDNRIENLVLFSNNSEHIKHHWKDEKYREPHLIGMRNNYKRRKEFNSKYPELWEVFYLFY